MAKQFKDAGEYHNINLLKFFQGQAYLQKKKIKKKSSNGTLYVKYISNIQ